MAYNFNLTFLTVLIYFYYNEILKFTNYIFPFEPSGHIQNKIIPILKSLIKNRFSAFWKKNTREARRIFQNPFRKVKPFSARVFSLLYQIRNSLIL